MRIVKFENKEGEYEKILEFLKVIDKDFYPPLSERGSLKDYLDNLINGVIVYLTENNKVVGLIGYQYLSKKFNCAYLHTIAILKEFRGRKMGKLLLEICLADLKSKKIKKVKTRTWSTNEISTRLYEKAGFKVCDVVKNDRGPEIDSIYFEKEL